MPASLSPEERAEVESGCYELLLVLAEAVAQPRPGEDPRRQVDDALRILDQTARVRPPTQAYHLRRAACLARKGDMAEADRERHPATLAGWRPACERGSGQRSSVVRNSSRSGATWNVGSTRPSKASIVL